MKNVKHILMAIVFAGLVLATSQAVAKGEDGDWTKGSAKWKNMENKNCVFSDGERSGRMGWKSDGRKGRPGRGMRGGRRKGHGMEFMRQRQERYITWLDGSFPEEAEALRELKGRDPKSYMRRIRLSGRKYGKIMRAEKQNPELAKVLKEDISLKTERNEILKKLRATAGEKDAKKLTAELKDVVDARFDLIIERKQLRYAAYSKKLAKLQKEIVQQKSEVEKLKKKKDELVKERLGKMLEKSESINWN